MLRFVTVDNFKSFRERANIPIGRGVNVVAGENGWVVSRIVDQFVDHVCNDRTNVNTFAKISWMNNWDF